MILERFIASSSSFGVYSLRSSAIFSSCLSSSLIWAALGKLKTAPWTSLGGGFFLSSFFLSSAITGSASRAARQAADRARTATLMVGPPGWEGNATTRYPLSTECQRQL